MQSTLSYRLGLPGAWCNIDGTHVPLGKCPEDAKVMYTGRYGKPTMAFIVLAGHNYQIFHCSSEYPGYLNDIQLVTNDGEIMLLKQWQTKIPSGVPDVDLITTFVGGYCISDAGLPKSALYLDPTNND
jgi:hypothetical protein